MPEVVLIWMETEDLNKCGKRLADLIEAYRQDFSKYVKKYQVKCVELIFNEVPRLMGRKFKYSQLAQKGAGSGPGFTSQGIRCS